MFEQLTQLVQQFGNESVVKNDAIPNEQNEAVMNEASSSILSGLQNIVSDKTLIVVTHKTSLLQLVDRVIIMDNGKIIVDGHKETVFTSKVG